MNGRESLRIAWRSITGHKLRATLTTLGVIIGIASVIAFMVLGGAFTEDIVGDLDQQNAPVMQVMTQTSPSGGTGVQFVDTPIYTASDADAIRDLDGVEYVAPVGDLPAVQLSHGGETVTGGFDVRATVAAQFEHGDPYRIERGETFAGPGEAVVSARMSDLVSGTLSVGDDLAVTLQDGTTTNVTVAGIVNESLGGMRGQPRVYVPLDPHYSLSIESPDGTDERAYPALIVGAESLDRVSAVKAAVVEYFETDADARRLKAEDHTIAVQTIQDAVDQISGIVDQLTVFIVGIAAISLLVGSIGIANIMIVSVTERTREIGIMKAVGARRRDVVQLFLVESVILGAIGALFGVLGGVGLGYLAVSFLDWPMVYPAGWIAIAVVVGVGVGVVSGLYPAWRAANVDPIEALRRE